MTIATHFAELRELANTRDAATARLVSLDQVLNERRAPVADAVQLAEAAISAKRAEIEALLRESGDTSHTDKATGINAQIQKRTSWKVTSKADLFAAAKERPDLGLIVEAVDEKKAVELSKAANEPLPGIEHIVTETFAVKGL